MGGVCGENSGDISIYYEVRATPRACGKVFEQNIRYEE